MNKFITFTALYVFFSVFLLSSASVSQVNEPFENILAFEDEQKDISSTDYFFVDSNTIKNHSKNTDNIESSGFTPNTFREMTITNYDGSEVKIDGELNEPVWQKLKRYNNFSEVSPGDNTKPEVDTEVMMFYDKDNIYFGFICHDNDMTKVRKTFCERDRMFSDDFCGFFLDTFNEGRESYELFVNPYGIQGDLLWTTPGYEDETFDMIWYTAAKEYRDRWTVEIAIPLKSIRFPDSEVQDWQIQFLRIRPRGDRAQYSLIPLSRDDPSLFTDAIKIKGVRNIQGGKNLEVLPYVIGNQSGVISDESNANSEFSNEKIKGDFGINVKYGITSNITADVTYNPDFSQVEADAGVITANNTYAIFYNEKRPFFLEGANVFSSPTNVVYTRSINNPLYAVKTTGKIGKTEFGILSAYDQKTNFILPFREYSDFISSGRKSLSNIFRIKQTLYDDSYIGFIFTDRQVNKEGNRFLDVDGFNRNFGIDGKIRFLNNYRVDFQFLKSVTKEINYPEYENTETFGNGKYNAALDGESYSGIQSYLMLNREARYWNFNMTLSSTSPYIRRDNGFSSSNDNINLSTWQGYMFYPETKVLLRIQPQIYTHVIHDYAGRFREVYLQASVWMALFNQIYFSAGYHPVNSEVFGGIYHQGARSGYINFNINTFKILTFGAYADFGRSIIRSDEPSIGYRRSFSVWATFKPFDRLTIINDYSYFDLARSYGGEKLYAGYIFRNKTSYNFTRDITLRLIGEYDSFSGSFYLNPLASYKPNPFTIFYFGFTNSYNDVDTPEGKPRYVMTERQFFLKMQYLFRM